MTEPTVSIKTYALTFGALLALALTTTLVALVDLGPFTMVIAVTFATLKALLIAGFFMHALFDAKLIRVIIAGGVVWFLILVTLTTTDYMTRGWVPFPGK